MVNHIEFVWAFIKNRVAKRNTSGKKDDVERLFREALAKAAAHPGRAVPGNKPGFLFPAIDLL